jgi:DNA-directed RNA polymerase II subunit RPB2
MAIVTMPSDSAPLYECVNPYVLTFKQLTQQQKANGVKVFVNGTWLGNAKDPMVLFKHIRTQKMQGVINIYTSVIFNAHTKEIHVNNDAGRIVRPLLRVDDHELVLSDNHMQGLRSQDLTWEHLLLSVPGREAALEYIDAAEQNNALIAMRPDQLRLETSMYSHCEIHPSTIFGILASCIPFPENNQSPRNTYQCAMGKQAMGMYVTNYDLRMDKTSYVLTYPMRPLVDTRLMNIMNINQLPSGEQVIVAIMTHSGYNQEDSILFNRGSIDRGLFTATIYHTEKDENRTLDGDQEIRCKPDPSITKGIKFGDYSKINYDGIIPENTLISNNDVIIAKVCPIKDARNDPTKVMKYADQSKVFRTSEESYIDKNYIERNGDGYKFCKVRVRTMRKPVIGDKCSSRHGQKGTIGNIIPEEDMPFLDSGVRPDLIINPHAIPSRMTIAQLKETLLGKALLELGMFGDGTSFGNLQVHDICKELQRLGYESNGNELMHDGQTGEQMETSVFVGPVYYQRLKHMVNDKVHSRNSGPKVNLTRQPAEGRSRDGGLRYGEMERDGMCSHGASEFNKERLYDVSDAYEAYVCKRCGMIAAHNNDKHIHHCRTCDNRTDFDYVRIPYACKLMFQELLTMNVAPRIITK